MAMDEGLLDDIIRRLLGSKNGRATRQVNITEAEIRQLCVTSKEVFLAQPNLLELEAPIKICGYGTRFIGGGSGYSVTTTNLRCSLIFTLVQYKNVKQ